MIKKILIFYTCFCALASSYAQNSEGVNALFIKSVEHSLYIVRVDYMLRLKSDPNREFTKGKRDYFGRVYGLALGARGYLWFDERLKKPWDNIDRANYDRYRSDTSLTAFVSRVAVRKVDGKKFMEPSETPFDKLEEGNISTIPLPDSLKSSMELAPEKDTIGLVIIGSLDKSADEIENEDFKVNLALLRVSKAVYENNSDEWRFSAGISGVTRNFLGCVFFRHYVLPNKIEMKAAGVGKRVNLNLQISPLPPRAGIAPVEELTEHKKEGKSEKQEEPEKKTKKKGNSSKGVNDDKKQKQVTPIENRSNR